MPGLRLRQENCALGIGDPPESPAVAVSCSVSPSQLSVPAAGITETPFVTWLTITAAESSIPPTIAAACTHAVPFAVAVRRPVELIAATDPFEVLQLRAGNVTGLSNRSDPLTTKRSVSPRRPNRTVSGATRSV